MDTTPPQSDLAAQQQALLGQAKMLGDSVANDARKTQAALDAVSDEADQSVKHLNQVFSEMDRADEQASVELDALETESTATQVGS